MRIRKILPFVFGAGALALIGYATPARSADHLDSPAVIADPTGDITDVYSWMDTTNAVLVLNVNPAAATTAMFSNATQYVIHTASGMAFGTTSNPVDVIATFDAAQKIQLWVGTTEYVTGDASVAAGLASADGKVKVFAGPRADPFHFNLDGFKATVADVEAAAGGLMFDPAGCPTIDAPTSAVLVNQLKSAPDGGAPVDFFKTLNVLSIIVSVDKTLLTAGGPIVSVWGATYK
jgi:hypothetical protein